MAADDIVVQPPRMPTPANNLGPSIRPIRTSTDITTPMRKAPEMLTVRIVVGKCPEVVGHVIEHQYLANVPNAPPIPT
jgi:hypothetical protein